MSAKKAVIAILSIIIGVGMGYFWHMSRPQDGIELVIGLSLLAIGLVFFSLNSMGKH